MSKRTFMKLLVASIILSLCMFMTRSYAGENVNGGKTRGLEKTTGNDIYRWFTINNLFNYYNNTGDGSINPNTGQSGFEFPKGSTNTATFEDGIVWGGFHKGRSDPKVGGSTYWRGLQAGAILTPGGATEAEQPVADDATLAKYRPYMVRTDVTPNTSFSSVQAKLEAEAALISRYSSITAQQLYDIYVQDWNEWPAKDGLPAPYKDVNGDGRYDPNVDIPGQPGADQTLYYVANDVSSTRTTAFYGSPPIGLEMHRTIWGYNLSGALGNTVFESTLIINKSGAPLDSAYFVQWSDVDLGDAGDDYTGCDVARGLGYTYNGSPVDGTYGVQVPATGYTFFQGPIVRTDNPADVAVFRLKYRPGYKNLGMTTFVFFINGNATYADPVHGTGGDIQWYRLMNGLISSSGSPFLNPITSEPTKFTLDGDPVSGTGWIDGTHGLIPGDRRQCQVTGPFTLANGDTQEVVVAHLVGLGSDRISSIAVLKWYSDLAQSAYNSLFDIAFPPPTPTVDVVALDRRIALNWADTGIETFSSVGYAFEGYNVYQFPGPSPDITTGVRLATYDLVDAVTTIFDDVYDASTGYVLSKPVEFGTDSGIKRHFEATTDAITSRYLANGTPYYFGVTSYSFNPTGTPSHLESAPDLLTIVPQAPNPGVRSTFVTGDTLPTLHVTGVSEGLAIPIVMNANKLTGHMYKVSFEVTEDGATVWNLIDSTARQVKLSQQTNLSGDDSYAIVDGFLVKVTGPTILGMKDWGIPSGTRRFTFAESAGSSFALEGFEQSIGWGDHWFSGTTLGAGEVKNTVLKLAKASSGTSANDAISSSAYYAGWDRETTADPNMSYGYRYLRAASAAAGRPEFAPYIVNPTSGYAYQDYKKGVPFSAWDTEANPPRRLAVGFLENNQPLGMVDGCWWPIPNGIMNTGAAGNSPREWAFIFDKPYTDATPDASLQTDILNNTVPIMWILMVNRRGGANFNPDTESGVDQFEIIASHINTPADAFVFTAIKPTATAEDAKQDVQKINVFPNPYIGFNPLERDKYTRFVTFSHLPTKATIRIFNLAGVLVRTLQKDGPDQFYQWDLKNESGFPVAAGMYIIYIDMPDLGTTKTLKLGVIPEQQYIDRW